MSGWSGIYFRYDVEDRRFSTTNYKGLIGNQYKGFEPYHIFVRATEGVSSAVGCLIHASYGNLDENVRRTIDVDFVSKCIEINSPASIWGEDEDSQEDANEIQTDEVSLGIRASSFFFNDCNYYGGCLVDVKGFVNERVEQDDEHAYGRRNKLEIKYAFVDDTYCPKKIMTPRQYVDHFSEHFNVDVLGEELMGEINRILTECDKGALGELMTKDELAEYLSHSSVKAYMQSE